MLAYPQYPFPWKLLPQVLAAMLTGRRRSFRLDALSVMAWSRLPVCVQGQEFIPQAGPALVVFNHYSRPGFGVWWLALAIAACVPVEMHWAMSVEWTTDGTLPATLRAWWSRWFFPRLAGIYGFTPMPPMPPRPFEVEARARAVRHILQAARRQPAPVIGLAPEGRDTTRAVLDEPPAGMGRMLQHLAGMGSPLYPLGAWEAEHALQLSFGPPFLLPPPSGLSRDELDQTASRLVMQAIARQLPAHMQGMYR